MAYPFLKDNRGEVDLGGRGGTERSKGKRSCGWGVIMKKDSFFKKILKNVEAKQEAGNTASNLYT